MRELYHIFVKDNYIGDLLHDTDGDRYIYTQKDFGRDGEYFNFRLNANTSELRFRDTIYSTRVFPKDRVNASQLLRELNLLEYNRWEILKKTQFISDDCIWMSKDLDGEWFWFNHPLACTVLGYSEKTGKPMFVS